MKGKRVYVILYYFPLRVYCYGNLVWFVRDFYGNDFSVYHRIWRGLRSDGYYCMRECCIYVCLFNSGLNLE